jgi:palmitoyl-protein thioesterase
MIHGINQGPVPCFNDISAWAKAEYPGILTFALDAFDNSNSYTALNTQIPVWAEMVKNITDQYGEITLLGYSQGGIVSRAVIEYGNNPNIHTFISLSGPGAGEYGIPEVPDFPIVNATASTVYLTCYNPLGQQMSVCDYWNDPHQQVLYKKFNTFLPVYNNLVTTANSAAYKKNFSNLTKFVMIGGNGDKVIIPWQSAQYGFWANNEVDVIPYQQQQFYIDDSFGLKTLDQRGAVEPCTVNGVCHTCWPSSHTAYNQCIGPNLV